MRSDIEPPDRDWPEGKYPVDGRPIVFLLLALLIGVAGGLLLRACGVF